VFVKRVATVVGLLAITAMLMGCAQGVVDPQRSHSSQISTATPAASDVQPSFPIRAAFYYPWFPESWKQQGMDPFTKYQPSLGFYDSSSSATIRQHIQAMQYGGIKVGISSWWGVGTRSDTRLPGILATTAGTTRKKKPIRPYIT